MDMTSNRQPSTPDLYPEQAMLDAATLAPPRLPALATVTRAAHPSDDVLTVSSSGALLDDDEPDTIPAPPPDTISGEELVEFDHD